MRSTVVLVIFLFSIVLPRFSNAVIFVPSEKPAPKILEEEVYKGDLLIEGNTVLRIINKKLIVEGNAHVKDFGKLVLENAILEIRNYPEPKLIFSDNSQFQAKESIVKVFGNVEARHNSLIGMDKVVFVNTMELYDNAHALISNSWLFEDRFGGIVVHDRSQSTVTNTVIGGITLDFQNIKGVHISNFRPGVFETWSSEDAIAGEQEWGVVLNNVEVRENSGLRGDYELGWGVVADAGSDLTVENSVLNRFSTRFKNQNVMLEGLRIRQPYSGSWHGIALDSVVVQGEWSFLLVNTSFTIHDSEGVGVNASGLKDINIVSSEIVRFEGREFTGKVMFDNSTLKGPLWVYDNSDFVIGGSVHIEYLDPRFDDTSRMVRDLQVVLRKGSDAIYGMEGYIEYRNDVVAKEKSNTEGIAVFPIVFDETKNSYRESRILKINDQSFVYDGLISIFTSSPFVVDLGPQVNLEGFSFGLDGEGFFVEAFIVNRGFEPARLIEARMENPHWKIVSPQVLLLEKLEVGQKEPVMWRTELPFRGADSVEIRINGSNFPAVSKAYAFTRDRYSVYPVILEEEYFEGDENQFSFWACDEGGCNEEDSAMRLEEKGGDRAVRLQGRSFGLLNTVFHEESIALDMLLERGSANINFRSQPVNGGLDRYFVTLSNNAVSLSRERQGGFVVLAREAAEFSLNEWHPVTISHKDKHIVVFIGDDEALQYTDNDFLPEGVVSIEALDNSAVWFDDVVLKGKKNLPPQQVSPLISWFFILLIPFVTFFVFGFFGRKFRLFLKK